MRNQGDVNSSPSIDADILVPEEEALLLDETDAPFLRAAQYGLPGGMARIRVASDSLEWIVAFVLKYAGKAVVEGPENVREAVVQAAEDILQTYREKKDPNLIDGGENKAD